MVTAPSIRAEAARAAGSRVARAAGPSTRRPTASSPEADIDPELLRATQSYLECRSFCLPPWPELSAAWDQFYDSYAPLLRRFALSLRVPRDSVDDCVQLAWVELLGKLPAFDYDPRRGRFCSWLFSIVRSKAVDLRRRRTKHLTETLPADWEEALPDRDADPAAWFERHAEQEGCGMCWPNSATRPRSAATGLRSCAGWRAGRSRRPRTAWG
jgi:hypothetical protein